MNVLRVLLAKFGKVFLVIFATFRRALCCFRRRRLSDSLPFTADVSRLHFPSDGAIMQSWTSWDDQEERGPSSVAVESFNQSHVVPASAGPTGSRGFGGRLHRQESEGESEPDVDFFHDMVPEIRRPAKIIIRKHDDVRNLNMNEVFSGRLAVDPQLTSSGGELGHWEENEGSWEDSMDIAMDDDSIHRESKLLDRERRAAENVRRKQEKDAIRMVSKRDHLATKIS